MANELIFTSVPHGLKPGSRGFATVAHTAGMPASQVEMCESLSGYTYLYPLQDENYANNPVAFSHYRFRLGGQVYSVLSRVAAYEMDYSGRSNKLAHHVMVSEAEHVDAGPAKVMQSSKCFRKKWDDKPDLIHPARSLHDLMKEDPAAEKDCEAEKLAYSKIDHEGWARVIAQRFKKSPDKPVFLIFEPEQKLLSLIAEVIALLPVDKRWKFTFSTYFTALPQGTDCFLRCCLAGAEALNLARRAPDALLVKLTDPPPDLPEDGELVEAAPAGVAPKADEENTVDAAMPATGKLKNEPLALSPSIKGGEPEAHNPAHGQIVIPYDDVSCKSPAWSSLLGGRPGLNLAVAAATLCVLVGIALWALQGIRGRSGGPENTSESAGLVKADTNNNKQEHATSIADAILQEAKKNETNVQEATKTPPKSLDSDPGKMATQEKSAEPVPPVRKKKDPIIAFVLAPPIGDSILATNLYGNTTTGFLYRTSGEVEELSPVRSGLKIDYAFKTRDSQWRMVASKNGKLLLESTTNDVALVRFKGEDDVLFIVFAPMQLTQKTATNYPFLKEFHAYRELSHLCQTARVHLAFRGHPEICCDIDAPVQLKTQGVKLSYDATDDYKKFKTKDPAQTDIQKMKGYLALLKSHNNEILQYLVTTPACAELVWGELDKVNKGGKTGLTIDELPHYKEMTEPFGANRLGTIKKHLDTPLSQLRNKYNKKVSSLEDDLRHHKAAGVAGNVQDILELFTDSAHMLNELKPKPDAPEPEKQRYKDVQALFNQDLADLKKKVEEWKNTLNDTALAFVQNQAGKQVGVTETTVMKCECKISNTVVWAWSAKQP